MKDITSNELNEYKVINSFVVKRDLRRSEYCYNIDDIVTATMHKRKNDRYLIVIYNINKDGKYVSIISNVLFIEMMSNSLSILSYFDYYNQID